MVCCSSLIWWKCICNGLLTTLNASDQRIMLFLFIRFGCKTEMFATTVIRVAQDEWRWHGGNASWPLSMLLFIRHSPLVTVWVSHRFKDSKVEVHRAKNKCLAIAKFCFWRITSSEISSDLDWFSRSCPFAEWAFGQKDQGQNHYIVTSYKSHIYYYCVRTADERCTSRQMKQQHLKASERIKKQTVCIYTNAFSPFAHYSFKCDESHVCGCKYEIDQRTPSSFQLWMHVNSRTIKDCIEIWITS